MGPGEFKGELKKHQGKLERRVVSGVSQCREVEEAEAKSRCPDSELGSVPKV